MLRAVLAGIWILLGVAAGFTILQPIRVVWLVLLGAPWLAGAAAILVSDEERVSAAGSRVREFPHYRLAIELLVLGCLIVIPLFGIGAAVMSVLWLASGTLVGLLTLGPTRVVETWGRALLAGGALLVCFLVAEAVLNFSPVAGRLGVPSERRAWEQRYDRLWESNTLGLRSRHERVERTPGTLRVVAIGDSYTWGDKIASSDSIWPALLEGQLGETRDGVEVFNLARRGFTTANEVELMNRLGWSLQPDIVVLQYLVNDVMESWPNYGNIQTAAQTPVVRILPARLRNGFVGRSAVLWFVQERLNDLARRRVRGSLFTPLYEEDWPGWRQARQALRELADSARNRSVPTLFVVFPSFPGDLAASDPHPHRELHDKVLRTAQSYGLATLDLTPAFAAEGGRWESWWALPWDSHPNVRGHAVAARLIAADLQRRGWIPPQLMAAR